jgi:acyl-CoA synthetase (AMP-forming)/AMP-acid ligase II
MTHMDTDLSKRGISTLVDLLLWRAQERPDERAYTFLVDGETEQATLTYRGLDQQARTIGALLQSVGAADERVLLLYPAGLDYIAAFFGCLYARALAVPVYPPHPARLARTLPRLRAIVQDAQPLVVLTTSPILAMAEQLVARDPAFKAVRWLATDQVADPSSSSGQALAGVWRDPGIDGSTLAFLQYTSGSTATPKGVMLAHGNLLYNGRMIQTAFEHTNQSTFVGWLPLYHDMGLIGDVLQPLQIGARSILMSPLHFLQRPFRWLRAITRYRARTSGAPNFAYDLCVRKITPEQRAMLDLSSWQIAFNGAEPVRTHTLERFTSTFGPCGFRPQTLYPCYGLAEATLFVTGGLKKDSPVVHSFQADALAQGRVSAAAAETHDAHSLAGCGRTWMDQQIIVVDPGSLTLCPPDRIGEIWVSGPNVAHGYWNQPEETEATFGAHLADTPANGEQRGQGPFLRTGDLGFLKDGELFITGRLKDLIIIDGLNHYPQDIELTVEHSHPTVRPGCSAAFSVDAQGREQLVIVAEVGRGDPRVIDTEEVTRAIRSAVSEWHDLQTHAIVLLKPHTIFKTSSGKIQRRACRDGFVSGSLDVWES